MDVKTFSRWHLFPMWFEKYFFFFPRTILPVGGHTDFFQEEPLVLQLYPHVLVFVVLSQFVVTLPQVGHHSNIGTSDMRTCAYAETASFASLDLTGSLENVSRNVAAAI